MISQTQPWAGIPQVEWIPVLQKNIAVGSQYQVYPTEGYIAWEYNPLRNYRLSQNMYEKDGKYYTLSEMLKIEKGVTVNPTTGVVSSDFPEGSGWILHEAGELVDFITDELKLIELEPIL
jgi:hypothetical protein